MQGLQNGNCCFNFVNDFVLAERQVCCKQLAEGRVALFAALSRNAADPSIVECIFINFWDKMLFFCNKNAVVTNFCNIKGNFCYIDRIFVVSLGNML